MTSSVAAVEKSGNSIKMASKKGGLNANNLWFKNSYSAKEPSQELKTLA